MKRTVAVVGVLVAVVALWFWRGHHHRASSGAGKGGPAVAGGPAGGGHAGLAVADPRTLAKASIRGVVREKGGGPIAGAQVCTTWNGDGVVSEDSREPRCATTDATGAYALTDLVPAWHTLGASAAEHIPRPWHDPTTDEESLKLAPGEARGGVDFALPPGGVKITGVVEDVSGGPVAAALVSLGANRWSSSSTLASARTDDQGHFTLWGKPGSAHVTAIAEGYADGETDTTAPTALVHLYLTPESSLSGTVVSADDQHPIAGATVELSGGWFEGTSQATARSDAAGHFRLTRLSPGRYKPTASGDNLYGEPAESVLLGLGQSVDGVIIPVGAASAVRGKVVVDSGGGTTAPCKAGMVSINDKRTDHDESDGLEPDGTFALTHVLPGHYEIDVRCTDFLSQDRYPPIDVVAGKDVDGLVWTVSAGGRIVGTIKDAAGQPIEDAMVSANATGAGARSSMMPNFARSHEDGRYEIKGLAAGDYTFFISADDQRNPAPPPKATVTAGGQTTVDIVMPGGGSIAGVVVDTAGKPVPGASVNASGGAAWSWNAGASTDDNGAFTLVNVEPGVHRVTASRGWFDDLRKPGTTDDDKQGEQVKVVANQTATTRLVVEAEDGKITGIVKEAKGDPVVDAWIIATRESDAAGMSSSQAMRSGRWSWGNTDRPIITGTDGRFTVGGLSRGVYTLRAYRRGGGEAVAEHVALGADTTLTIPSTGSFAGVVVMAGATLDEVDLNLRDAKTGFSRDESYYRTGGKFVMRDLPAGDFVVTADAAGGHAESKLTLTAGEDKAGVTITLEAKLTVKGRFVDLETSAPIPGLRTSVSPVRGGAGGMMDFGEAGDQANVSGADGRFTVTDCPSGLVSIFAMPGGMMDPTAPYSFAQWTAELTTGPEIDVGDIPVAKRRIGPGDHRGSLGMSFVHGEPGADPRQRVLTVAHVDADGPAARATIVAGDVIVTVDGFDVKGVRSALVSSLLSVKVGTVLKLGLQRGVEVSLTTTADD